MKRRGSALVSVLIASSLLLGLGTIVSATVVNTTKLNQRYSENIDLELAAKSALNYGIDYLTNNYRTIGELGFKQEGILSDDQTNITKSIEISKSDDEFTIIGRAKLNRNSEISAEESTVIKISNENTDPMPNPTPNPIPDPTPDKPNNSEEVDEILVFNKLFNIGKDIISFGDSQQNAINQFEYGGQCCDLTPNNGQNAQKPSKNEFLSKININLKYDKINSLISKYNTIESIYHDASNISLENKTIVYKKLDGNNLNINLKESNILFQEGGSSSNDTKIPSLNESEIFINGNANFSKIHISNMNNSKLIVNGNLEIQNELSINRQNYLSGNNLILINGNLNFYGNGPEINLKNSIIIVVGDLYIQNQLKLEMQNSVIICIKNNKMQSLGYKTGNLNFGTNPTITNYNGSYLYCYGDFKVGNIMSINNYGDNLVKSEFVNNTINEFLTVLNN